MIKKLYAKLIEWIWFQGEYHRERNDQIAIVKGWNYFLVDDRFGKRRGISIPYLYRKNIAYLFKRVISCGHYK